MRIRLLSAEDGAAYRQLMLESLATDPFAFSDSPEDIEQLGGEAIAERLAPAGEPPESFVLGAMDGAQLIGSLTFRRDPRRKARHKSMIHAMYVRPGHRGRGVGRRLIDEVILRARGMPGLEQIHAWVLHAGDSAAGFYERVGFRPQMRIVDDLVIEGRYVDAMYFSLFLSPPNTIARHGEATEAETSP